MKKISGIVTTITSVFLLFAALIFQCPTKDDGTYMHCHNANIAIAIISCVILVLSIISLMPNNKLTGYITSIVIAIASVFCSIVPGIIISLCMMPEMTCRATMRPTAIISSVIIFISAIVSLLFTKKESI
jgi:hypothetical protein